MCLVLTGVCVVILCIGIGIGIAHGKGNSEDEVNSNDTSLEYVLYDEDYVGADENDQRSEDKLATASVLTRSGFGGATQAKPRDQGTTETVSLTIKTISQTKHTFMYSNSCYM